MRLRTEMRPRSDGGWIARNAVNENCLVLHAPLEQDDP